VDWSVDQSWPEPVGGIGRMQVGDDLQFVAKRDRGQRSTVIRRGALSSSGAVKRLFDGAPVHGVVHVVEQVDVGDPQGGTR
jgi:hypothetical protein